MPDARKHRGPGPKDPTWFAREARPLLRAAVADLSWLLSRGYAVNSSLKLVGDRYNLVERQRLAVVRSSCSDGALAGRLANRVAIESHRGQPLRIDGFNLVLTLESALGGGVLLGGRDGCLRDLAGVHGTYRRVEETTPALRLAACWLREWGIGPCTWLLDAPVSNSGRLASMIRGTDPNWNAEVVPDPDILLSQPGAPVATADSVILDRCGSWINLARAIVATGIPDAFIAELGPEEPPLPDSFHRA
jgi:hypothetical protein